MSELMRLGLDLLNLVDAYRATLPATDIKALAEDVVLRIRALPVSTKVEFALWFDRGTWPPRAADGSALNLDRVCEAVNRVQNNQPTPADLQDMEAASGFFRLAGETPMPIEEPAAMSLYDISLTASHDDDSKTWLTVTDANVATAAEAPPAFAKPSHENEKPPPRLLTEPSTDAFTAYRACKIMGRPQQDVADTLHTNQGQVSRWVRQVSEWIQAGNVLPDLPGMSAKPAAIDPDVIDMGERADGRAKRQRDKHRDE